MIKLLVTGASGTAGSEVVRQAVLHPGISQVTALVRRELPPHIEISDPKVRTIIHKDFSTCPPSLVEQLRDHDAVIWAQGVSSVGYKEADYDVITRQYPMEYAKRLAEARGPGANLTFCYVSGEGADQEKPARAMFGRVKGNAEKDLAGLADSLPIAPYSFRPAGIAPINPIPEAALLNRVAMRFFPLLRMVMPSFIINTDVLARGLIEVAVNGSSGEMKGWEGKGKVGNSGVFTNEEIKLVAASSPIAA